MQCVRDLVRYIPMVGIVVTISPSLSLYRIVVLPAASKPTIRMPVIVVSILSFAAGHAAHNLHTHLLLAEEARQQSRHGQSHFVLRVEVQGHGVDRSENVAHTPCFVPMFGTTY